MKRRVITGALVAVVLLIVCYTGVCVYAALTKTTALDIVDDWQAVTAGTMVVGTAQALSSSYSTILYLESGYIEADATDGIEYTIEVSYAAENWVALTTVKGTAETPDVDDVNDASSEAGDAYLILTDAVTGDFDVVGRKILIWEAGTPANSESVRVKSKGVTVDTDFDTLQLASPTLRNHADTIAVYDRVDEWVISIPFGASQVRVLANNVDATCDCAFTSRVSQVSAIQ